MFDFGIILTHLRKALCERHAATPGRRTIRQPENGAARIQVRLKGYTVSLPRRAMAELFEITTRNIGLHTQQMSVEGNVGPEARNKQCLTVQTEANRQIGRAVDHHNLDLIIAVGYPGWISASVIPPTGFRKKAPKGRCVRCGKPMKESVRHADSHS